MKIVFTPNTNFKAKFIKTEPILKLSDNAAEYNKHDISIAKIEIDKAEDIQALQDSAKSWGVKAYFSQDIADSAAYMHGLKEKIGKDLGINFYIATLQKDSFDKLRSDEILGMAETNRIEPKHLGIKSLQVSPSVMHAKVNTEYKGIGRSIIRALKAQKENKIISLVSMYSAANFYEKMGFILTNPENLMYVWRRFKPKH